MKNSVKIGIGIAGTVIGAAAAVIGGRKIAHKEQEDVIKIELPVEDDKKDK